MTPKGRFRVIMAVHQLILRSGCCWIAFWKSVLSKEQREGLARYVPVEYSNRCLDEQGFVYATLSYTDSNKQQLRRLNYMGNNIFPYVENFGEDEVFDYKREKWYTKFTGVAAERDFVYALDSQWQRVYLFDKEGNRLAVFGAQGEQTGSFRVCRLFW